ncbi:uncharacterized protein METZ01_LOCUS506058 [marine metagenome]|uniref:Uncharacterized protein n=1 Tax=marine metagenome TaxID=408172 RepID=A0A383E9A7_9ZZZZ
MVKNNEYNAAETNKVTLKLMAVFLISGLVCSLAPLRLVISSQINKMT